uniref:Uncharacterized protein n=1 Tax=Thiomonas intermedia (strain K12) TaxID=75379 RepID=D5X2A5_THIK1
MKDIHMIRKEAEADTQPFHLACLPTNTCYQRGKSHQTID